MQGGGDVVAVVKDNGWSAGGNGATASTVAGQYVYDAYGSVLAAESLATYPALHLGHKGLFFDRLDVGVVDSVGAENLRLDQGAHATYYMRNRWYSSETGRFLQRDPNATSMVLIESAASHGRGIGAAVAALSPDAMFGDGHNLYQYLGSNPWNRQDPLGTSYDPFDDVDEFVALDAASKAAFFDSRGRGMLSAANLVASIVSYLPIPGAGLIGEISLAVLNGEDIGPILARAAIGLVPGGKLATMALTIGSEFQSMLSDREDAKNGRIAGNPDADWGDMEGSGDAEGGGSEEPTMAGAASIVRGGSRAASTAAANLKKMGLKAGDLFGKSYNAGRKRLEAAGFEFYKTTTSGRRIFLHPKLGSQVWFDSKGALTAGQRNHWHTLNNAGHRFTRRGRHDPLSGPGTHIPSN